VVARFDRQHNGDDVAGGSDAVTLGQMIDSFSKPGCLGDTGEIVPARRVGEKKGTQGYRQVGDLIRWLPDHGSASGGARGPVH